MNKLHKFLVAIFLVVSTLSLAQPVNGMSTFFTNTTTALAANTSCSITKTVSLDGWLFSVSSTSNCGFNQTNSTGGDGRLQYLVGFGTLSQATFGSDNGNEFALQSLTWGVSTSSWTSKAMTFIGYKNGMAVPGATLNATTPSGTGILNTLVVNFGGNSAFNDVDDIALAPNSATCNSILFFEDITVSTATPSCFSPTLSVTGSSNVLCNGQSNGSATLSASGGSGFTYTWSPSGGNAASATGLSAGIYTLSCTNSTCATISTQTVQITQPTALSTSTSVTNALCNGGNGSATITASGGTGAYTYSWSSGANTSVVTLLAGVYTATVTDANNCKSNKSVTITQPTALTTNTAVTNALCNSGSGSATITASGGTGAYTYSWSSGATTSNITNLAGAYTATVSDANNCTSNKSVIITQPSAITINTAITNVLCNGGNGSATITTSGGTGAYTYSWSSGATASIISNIAGVYTATVTDANNCSALANINITQPSALVTSTLVTNALCNGANGSATIAASGGTGVYTYLWSNTSTSSVITVIAGVYTSTVTDVNSCSSIKTITVTQPTSLATTTAVTNVLCYGGNGSATITASGGTGAYTYSWSSGATTSVITNIAGTYTVSVSDVNNCTSVKNINITQPLFLLSLPISTGPLCNGGVGSASVIAVGGTGAYTYSWSSGASTQSISNVAGVYTVSVIDANSCASINTITITQPPALISSIAIANVSCNGGTGSATLTASGGTGAYTYSWSSGPTTSVISNVAGVYTATVTDANSCTTTNTTTILQPTALTTNTALTNAICNGGNGSATITASGGIGAYTYLWSNAATTSVIATLAGVYTATVTDVNGCTSIKSLTITQPPALTLTLGLSVQNICAGFSSTISAYGSGGTGTYSYSWPSGVSTTSVSVVSPTISTDYTVSIIDGNNCITSQTVSLIIKNLPTVTVNSGTICSGQSFTINPSGAPVYSYTGSLVVSPNVTTSYTIYGIGSNGCWNNAVSTVTVYSLPNIITSNYTICTGQTVTLTPTGATTYTFGSSSSTVSPIVSPTITTVYHITGTSLEGCVTAGSVVSNVYVNSTSITVSNGAICPGNSFTITPSGAVSYTYTGGSQVVTPAMSSTYAVIGTGTNGCVSAPAIAQVSVLALPTLTLNNGSVCPGYSFTLNPQGASTYTYLNGGPIVSPSVTTIYSVTGTSPEGCPASNTGTAVVTVTNTLTVSITGTDVICNGQTTTLTASGASTYSWSTNVNTSTVSLNPSVNTSYTAYGSNGSCSNSAIVTVTVKPSPTVSISGPNSLCIGETITLTANGGDTYLWDNSSTSNSIVVSPTSSKAYTAIGTSSNNCSSSTVYSVTVNALPLISISSTNSLICVGETASLTASGASSYSWSTGANAVMIVVTPTSLANYTVTGMDDNTCVNATHFTLDVSECTGINTINSSLKETLKVYPNPATNKLYFVSNNETEVWEVEIYDLNSRLVQQSTLNFSSYQAEIKLDLPNGMYLISMVNKENIPTFLKLVIAN